jgi:CheY-like chemotaxis protein
VIFLGGPLGEEGVPAEPLLAWPPVARQLRRALLNEPNSEWEQPDAEAGCLVLAVDDNHINRMVVGEMLRALGCEVEEAPDGPSALDHPRLTEVELIFMDVDMPVLNGIETTRLLRQRGLHCPIVGLTGHATENVMVEAREAGMSQCMTKPTGLEQLRKVLQGRAALAASA